MDKISTGLEGLDEILHGGLIQNKAYLLQGGPGVGKSTVGLHFLVSGIQNGEQVLYITLGESEGNIKANASRMNFELSEVDFLDLSPGDDLYENANSYSVFSPSEVEQGPVMESIIQAVKDHKPDRVLLDSITMLRFLNQDPFQMRKMALSFINFITSNNATLMMTSESLDDSREKDATFWVDGIIKLESGSAWRKISVTKYRGSDYRSGSHAYKITGNGVEVFPQLRPNSYNRSFQSGVLSTGIEEIDTMLNGGIERGTTSLIVGPTGVGKTNLGLQFMKEAASRDDHSVLYSFEESRELIYQRSRKVSIPVDKMVETGNLKIMPVEPLSYSPDEFAKIVRTDVEKNNTQVVMIDSIGGYDLAVRDENILERLHSLTVYLQNMGVTTLLINESQNVAGEFSTTKMNASYLADNIIFLRYLEVNGQLKKAIGVLKKRLSDFENTIREYAITNDGIKVGKPLDNLRGILSGLPETIK